MVAAEALGLGTVAIGSLRQGAAEVIKLLNLPKYTVPINGLCIGHIADMSTKKPRLSMDTFVHNETYNTKSLSNSLDAYDIVMEEFMSTNVIAVEPNWTSYLAARYKGTYHHLHQVLIDQGFQFNK